MSREELIEKVCPTDATSDVRLAFESIRHKLNQLKEQKQ